MKLNITKAEIADLKSRGILMQRQEGYFSIRIVSRAGNFTAKQLMDISKISEEFGSGYVGFTTRLAAEIPWIKYEDVLKVEKIIRELGMVNGGTGKKVRPLVACKGTVCPHGIYDTGGLCTRIGEKYFAYDLPSKTKITFVGCPNNCAKANTNDLGFMGQTYVDFNEEKCKNCGLCINVCRQKSVKKIDNKVSYDKDSCVNCGKCATVCPFGAMTIKESGIAVFLGGRMGRGYRFGDRLKSLYKEDEIEGLISIIFDVYKNMANDGERISKVIERVGFETFENAIYEKKNLK